MQYYKVSDHIQFCKENSMKNELNLMSSKHTIA